MKRFKLLLTGLLSGIVLSSTVFAADTSSPVGFWKTIDDKTGQAKSIIKIWQADNQELMGKVIKIFPADGSNDQKKLCTACNGDKKNKPIVGMVVLTGLKHVDNQWKQGEILDPASGKTYDCNIKLSDNGKKLDVRGYVGLPIMGRSQTWERVDLMSNK